MNRVGAGRGTGARRIVMGGLALTAALVMASSSLGQATPPDDETPPLPAGWTGDVIVKFASSSAASKTTSSRGEALRAASRKAGIASAPGEKRSLASGATLVGATAKPQQLIAALKSRSDVLYAVPDVKVVTSATNDPQWSQQWNLHATSAGINVEPAWTRTKGAGARVAVVDTGRTAHPDLAGRFIGGYDFITPVTVAGDGNGRDADPTDVGDYCEGDPSSWHGTSVASTIAANANNSREIAGVAPAAQVVPLRVLGRCGGVMSDVMDAMVWAAGGTVTGVPANPYPAKIVNMSLSTEDPSTCDAAMQDAVTLARGRGALIVVAAGNENAPASTYAPANCAGVLTVAASTSTGTRAYYSNYGGPVDLAAPGGDDTLPVRVLDVGSTTTNNGVYGVSWAIGTSTAAPHVSGVAALLLSANPTLTVAQLESILVASTKGTACSGCGAGIIDAGLALRAIPNVTSTSFAQVGLSGGQVALVGAGLDQLTAVTIGGLAAPIVGTATATRVTVQAPAHLSPGKYRIALQTTMGTVNATGTITYVDLPRVHSLSATAAAAGVQVQVRGEGFLPGASVSFNDTAATVLSVTATVVTVVVPAGAAGTRAVVRVTTTQGPSSASKGSIFTWR